VLQTTNYKKFYQTNLQANPTTKSTTKPQITVKYKPQKVLQNNCKSTTRNYKKCYKTANHKKCYKTTNNCKSTNHKPQKVLQNNCEGTKQETIKVLQNSKPLRVLQNHKPQKVLQNHKQL